jgi:hypothetical protein
MEYVELSFQVPIPDEVLELAKELVSFFLPEDKPYLYRVKQQDGPGPTIRKSRLQPALLKKEGPTTKNPVGAIVVLGGFQKSSELTPIPFFILEGYAYIS